MSFSQREDLGSERKCTCLNLSIGRFHQGVDDLSEDLDQAEVEGKIGFELCSDREDKLTALHPWCPSGGQR